ncbi:Tripartite tricarboxylate transporter family receptor [compost metagenome]
MAELDAQIRKAGDGGLTYASSGQGGPQHIAGELYAHRIGVKVTHVPYKGESAALSDVLAGHVPYMFANLPVAKPYLESGKLRALAVTGLQRDDKSPAVPTMAESGFAGFEVLTWYGVFAPARTPAPVMDRLYGSIRSALDDADTRTRLTDQGFTVLGSKPAEFSAFVRDEVPRWSALIGDIGIRPE